MSENTVTAAVIPPAEPTVRLTVNMTVSEAVALKALMGHNVQWDSFRLAERVYVELDTALVEANLDEEEPRFETDCGDAAFLKLVPADEEGV